MRSKSMLLLAIAGVCALFMSACGADDSTEAASAGGQDASTSQSDAEEPGAGSGLSETIRIGVGIDTAYLPFFVAEQDGLFENAGLDVEVVVFPQGGEAIDALAAGELHAGGISEATIMLKAAPLPAGTIRSIGSYEESGEYIKLVGSSDLEAPEDIRSIGIVPGSGSEYGAYRMLDHYGVDPESVEFVSSGPSELPALMDRGEIDAVVLWEPWPTMAVEQFNGKIMATTADFGWTYYHLLNVRDDWLQGHEDEAATLMEVLADAGARVEEDPDHAAEVVATYGPIEADQTVQAVEEIDFLVRPPGDVPREELERIAEFQVDRGLVEQPVDLDALLTPGYVE